MCREENKSSGNNVSLFFQEKINESLWTEVQELLLHMLLSSYSFAWGRQGKGREQKKNCFAWIKVFIVFRNARSLLCWNSSIFFELASANSARRSYKNIMLTCFPSVWKLLFVLVSRLLEFENNCGLFPRMTTNTTCLCTPQKDTWISETFILLLSLNK